MPHCSPVFKFPAWGSSLLAICVLIMCGLLITYLVIQHKRKVLRESRYRRVNNKRVRSNLRVEINKINPDMVLNKRPAVLDMVE